MIEWTVYIDGHDYLEGTRLVGTCPAMRSNGTPVSGWVVRVEYRLLNGRPDLYSVTHERTTDENGNPGTSLMSHLGLTHLQRDAQRFITSAEGRFGLPVTWWDTEAVMPRVGRRGRSDGPYAIWARRYVEAVAESPRSPIKWLCEHYGEWPRDEDKMRSKIADVRGRGLLTRPKNTRTPSELTDYAREILAALEED